MCTLHPHVRVPQTVFDIKPRFLLPKTPPNPRPHGSAGHPVIRSLCSLAFLLAPSKLTVYEIFKEKLHLVINTPPPPASHRFVDYTFWDARFLRSKHIKTPLFSRSCSCCTSLYRDSKLAMNVTFSLATSLIVSLFTYIHTYIFCCAGRSSLYSPRNAEAALPPSNARRCFNCTLRSSCNGGSPSKTSLSRDPHRRGRGGAGPVAFHFKRPKALLPERAKLDNLSTPYMAICRAAPSLSKNLALTII